MTVIAVMLLITGSGACVDVNGGAAELSWYLTSFSEKRIDCGCAGIATVRLCWMPEGQALADAAALTCAGHRDIACTDNRGATDFDIDSDSESHLFWIEPLDSSGTPLAEGTYEVPPPIRRSVEHGSVVTLNSLLIVAEPRCDDTGDVCKDMDVCTSGQSPG